MESLQALGGSQRSPDADLGMPLSAPAKPRYPFGPWARRHATPGRGLNEELVGFYTGKSLYQWLPRTYVQLKYAYAFVERRGGTQRHAPDAAGHGDGGFLPAHRHER